MLRSNIKLTNFLVTFFLLMFLTAVGHAQFRAGVQGTGRARALSGRGADGLSGRRDRR